MERRREAALTGGTAGRRLTSIDGGRGSEDGAGPAGVPPQGSGPVRGVRPDQRGEGDPPTVPEQARLWHVVLSVSGQVTPLSELRAGLERLAHDHSFFLTARYAADHAEIRYWEQARDLHDAAAIALRLWGEHKATAKLPPWEIVGLEVVDRATYHKRVAEGFGDPPPHLGGVHPY
ncbi:hypothetical protein [Streptomyces sp. CB01881]|uniref:hypothetical protein n=1 Tax=Streptomyces sp. CB01881 TaxID=2078691 RepID=UPI000CDCB5DD|nr:hypothetical protein [Streptomyces sp. CB01881]AUY51792.1 hypothetical protein C2142_25965 [Streptomyces sp. CB01881]TYC71221.1 hypothetical protein EH183_25950 [Streptomyces sp. CB01881]